MTSEDRLQSQKEASTHRLQRVNMEKRQDTNIGYFSCSYVFETKQSRALPLVVNSGKHNADVESMKEIRVGMM